MSNQAFCTSCGAPRAGSAAFCTSCGAALQGAAAPSPSTAAAPAASRAASPAAFAVLALVLVAGGLAAWQATRTSTDVPRAVPGAPSTPGGAEAGGQELPSGHPSIELPKEITDFLAGLAAEAEKDPANLDAVVKLARARYRASVVNATWRVPAEEAARRVLALDAGNMEGLRISASLAYDGGDFPEAEKRFAAFVAKFPDDPGALTDLGSAQLFQEKTDEAMANYRKAIEKDPRFMQAHFNMGIALQKKGDKAGAAEELKKAQEFATAPEEKQHIENALAEVEGREAVKLETRAPALPGPVFGKAPGEAPAAPGMPMPPPAPERDVPTNASTQVQRDIQKLFITHPIVGPRVVSFAWSGTRNLDVNVTNFPVEQMPPFAKSKFKLSMAEKVIAIGKAAGETKPYFVDVVDTANGRELMTIATGPVTAGEAK